MLSYQMRCGSFSTTFTVEVLNLFLDQIYNVLHQMPAVLGSCFKHIPLALNAQRTSILEFFVGVLHISVHFRFSYVVFYFFFSSRGADNLPADLPLKCSQTTLSSLQSSSLENLTQQVKNYFSFSHHHNLRLLCLC